MDLGLFLLFMLPGTVFLGGYDVITKKLLGTGINSQLLIAVGLGSVGLLAWPILIWQGLPSINSAFWPAFIGTVLLNIISQGLWYKAFQLEEASLISPLRLLTPPLTIITGFLFLGEQPTLNGIWGIIIATIGLWFLLNGKISPKLLSSRPGIVAGLIGALLFALSFPLDKQAVINSSSLWFMGTTLPLIGAGNLFLGWWKAPSTKTFFHWPKPANIWLPIYILIHGIGSFLTIQALNYALVAYASSTKRLWSFWAVLFSGLFLKEKNLPRKLLATVIMLIGLAVMFWEF